MLDLGVRLQLLIGDTIPTPAPYEIVNALVDLEVRNETEHRDTFKITFRLGRERTADDFALIRSGVLDTERRVIVMMLFGARPEVLIDGIITRHQNMASNQPGQNQLVVFGESIALRLDLQERNETYRNQSDSTIVNKILLRSDYTAYGLVPEVTPTTDIPVETDRIPSQQNTDLQYIQSLAERNSFVFFIEPTAVPGVNKAYWGAENRQGLHQPPLTMNMGSATNVESFTAGFNTLAGVAPQVTITEPITGQAIAIPVPDLSLPSLTSAPAPTLRTRISRDSANLSFSEGLLRALTASNESADAADANGVLDAAVYGQALRARRLVDVRGAGRTNNGTYYVKQVTHRIKPGEYKQHFSLAREGRGATSSMVGL
jgi:hypothetical protein